MLTSSFYRKWYGYGTVLLIIMIGLGGITRLTDSGLSMVTWEPISGIFPPVTDSQWEQEFNKYKTYPEFQLLNSNITKEDFKFIYSIEYLHRMLGRLIGLYFILPLIIFSFTKKINIREKKTTIFLIMMIAFQGLIGWYMVKSGLSHDPNISHIRLMIHLLFAMLLTSYCYILYLRHSDNILTNQHFLSKKGFYIIFILLITQICIGALVAGLKAVYAYNTFPLMNGNILPREFFSMAGFFNNIFNEPYTIQFFHRLGGSIMLFLSIYILIGNIKSGSKLNSFENQFCYVLMFQFILGVLTLILQIPIILAVSHQIVACILLLSVVRILYTYQ